MVERYRKFQATVLTNHFRIIIILAVSTLSACVMVQKNHIEGTPLAANTGVLFVGLHTRNVNKKQKALVGNVVYHFRGVTSDRSLRRLIFNGKYHYLVVELPAGKYEFEKLTFGNRYRRFNENSFTIKPRTITYIGDITSNILVSEKSVYSTLNVKDKYENAINYMSTVYLKSSIKYPMAKKLIELSFKSLKGAKAARSGTIKINFQQ